MKYNKKGKVPVTGERNSFIGMYCRNLEFTPSKKINFRCFSGYYHRKKKLYRGKTGTSHAL